jgi:hypothetical protein
MLPVVVKRIVDCRGGTRKADRMKAQTLTANVCRISEEIWGEHWCAQASDALDIDMRTLQRIKGAGQTGEDLPISAEAFAAIQDFTVKVLKMVAGAQAGD